MGVSLANRQEAPFSLIMLDVDHFKQYNDAFGHPAGDDVLCDLARTLREDVRDHDLVARYGGEEFVLLLPMTDADAARTVGGGIRVAIAARDWKLRPITASLGIATTGPGASTPARLLERADRALYHSKATGRDRVTHVLDLAINTEDTDTPLLASSSISSE